jgi:hypothetical protein
MGVDCGDASPCRGDSPSSGNCFTGSAGTVPSPPPVRLAPGGGDGDAGLDDAGASVPFCPGSGEVVRSLIRSGVGVVPPLVPPDRGDAAGSAWLGCALPDGGCSAG